MKRSLLPFFILGFALPTWPIYQPKLIKPKTIDLPIEALDLIPRIGHVQAHRLHHHDWPSQPGIGPKTYKHLLKYVSL